MKLLFIFYLCSSFSYLTFSFYDLVHFLLKLMACWPGIKAAALLILTILFSYLLWRIMHLFSILTFALLESMVMMQGVGGGTLVGKKYEISL